MLCFISIAHSLPFFFCPIILGIVILRNGEGPPKEQGRRDCPCQLKNHPEQPHRKERLWKCKLCQNIHSGLRDGASAADAKRRQPTYAADACTKQKDCWSSFYSAITWWCTGASALLSTLRRNTGRNRREGGTVTVTTRMMLRMHSNYINITYCFKCLFNPFGGRPPRAQEPLFTTDLLTTRPTNNQMQRN